MSDVIRNCADEPEELIPVPLKILGSRKQLPPGGRIKLYDFRRPDKFSREQLRTMQILAETFGRLASTTLSAALRLPCELSVDLVDQMTYDEYLGPIEGCSTLAVVSMEPLKGQAVVHIDAAGSDALVERVFGSRLIPVAVVGEPGASERPRCAGGLTDIEAAQLERLLAAIAADLGQAWGFVPGGLEPALAAIETEARFCQIVPPTEMIVITACSLSVGPVKGRLTVVYPFLLLEPILHALSAKYWYERRGDEVNPRSLAAARRATLPAELVVDAGAPPVSLLRELRKGSVIELPDDDEGRAWLRLGGARVAELSGLRADGDSLSADFAGRPTDAGASKGAADPMAALAAELKAGLAAVSSGVSEAVSSMARRIDELKGGQEDLSDRVLFGQADSGGRSPGKPFSSLAGVPAEPFALFLSGERPQVCALVLSFLDDALAARLLSLLSEAVRPEVTRRIATMDWVTPQALSETERILGKKLSAIGRSGFEADGVKKVVGILNFSPRETERSVITALDAIDPELSESIKRSMFVFEDIIILDDESIAAVLERADEKDFVVAMKPMKDDERRRLLERLPAGSRERVGEAYDALGRVRMSDCDAAGFRVVEIVRSLEREGRIGIVRQGD